MFNRLDLENRGIDSLSGLDALESRNVVLMILNKNRMTTFHSFGTHPYLTELDIRNNQIFSLFGLTKQPCLEAVHLRGNPVAQHPLYRIMVLLTVGFSVRTVDGTPVSSEERKVARELGAQAALAVACGWLLDLKPRSDAAYIEEAKRAKQECVARLRTHKPLCTVADALAALRGHPADTPSHGLNSGASTAKTAERLSVRVSALTADVSRLEREKRALQDERTVERDGPPRLLSAGEPEAAHIPPFDAVAASCVEFDQGIHAVTNAYTNAPTSRVCLRITDTTLTVLSFMQRRVMVQVALNGKTRVEFAFPNVVLVQDARGVVVQLEFVTLLILCSVHNVLCLKAFGVAELLPLTSEQLSVLNSETAHRLDKLVSPEKSDIRADAAGETDNGVDTAPPPPPDIPTQTAGGSVPQSVSAARPSPTPFAAASAASAAANESAQLDFVADVPPLPTSRGYAEPSVPSSHSIRSTTDARPEARVDTQEPHSVAASGPPPAPAPAPAISRFQNLLVDSSDTSALTSARHESAISDDKPPVAAVADREGGNDDGESDGDAGVAVKSTSMMSRSSNPPTPQPVTAPVPSSPAAAPSAHARTAASPVPSPTAGEVPQVVSTAPKDPTPTAPATTTSAPTAKRFQAFMVDSDSDSDG